MAVGAMAVEASVEPVMKEVSVIHRRLLPQSAPSTREKAAGKKAWTAEREQIVSSMTT